MMDGDTVHVLRTPDEHFVNLPGYPFEPHYVHVNGPEAVSLRVHYVDEGPTDAPVVLLLHGEPSWSYLYRHMISALAADGLRAVAIDLIGFGRSDKPADRDDYTYQAHVDWTREAIDAVGLEEITLFCQDWGGLIGLRLVAENPDLFARVVASNTFLPTGDGKPSEAFLAWQKYSQETLVLKVGQIISGATVSELTPAVIAGYDAPFPDDTFKAGARKFPTLVPTSPSDPAAPANRAAWAALGRYDKPFLCAFSDSDPVTRGGDALLASHVPGTRNHPPVTIENAGHFLQEDKGEELARLVSSFISSTSS